MVRQKKAKTLHDDTSALTMAGTSSKVVEQYLEEMSFKSVIGANRHRKHYEFIKQTMLASLTEKQHKDPLFGAMIERIARHSIILDKLEYKFLQEMPDLNEMEIRMRIGGDYLKYLKEYRDYIRDFSDLRWAGDQIQKTKSVEKIMTIKREEIVDDTPTI